MDNKTQEDILNNDLQADESPNSKNASDDIKATDNLSDIAETEILESDTDEIDTLEADAEGTDILSTDNDSEISFSYDSEDIDDADVKKSDVFSKVVTPIVVVLSLVIVALALFVMNGSKINSSTDDAVEGTPITPSFKIDGKEVDTDDLVFLKINGLEIGFDELRSAYYQFLNNYGPSYGISEDTFKNLSGDELDSKFNSFKEILADYIKGDGYYVYASYAKDNNITLNEEDEKSIAKSIKDFKDDKGDDLESYLQENYITEKYIDIAFKYITLADKVEDHICVPEDDFYKTAKKELYQVKQIFIPFGSEEKISNEVLSENKIEDYDKLSNPEKTQAITDNFNSLSDKKQKKAKKVSKQVADDIYNQLVSGADFDTLMKDYTYDSLYESYPKGVLVGENYEYDKDYLEAALKLDENEMSKVVKSSLGYHIIMRVPLDKKYINKNVDYFAETYNGYIVNKVLDKVYENLEVEQTDLYKNFHYGDLT